MTILYNQINSINQQICTNCELNEIDDEIHLLIYYKDRYFIDIKISHYRLICHKNEMVNVRTSQWNDDKLNKTNI